jgi:hypothetical protein
MDQSQRFSRVARFLVAMLVAVLLFGMSSPWAERAAADGGGWRIEVAGGGQLQPNRGFSLYNKEEKDYLYYSERTFGINLEWTSKEKGNWVVVRDPDSRVTGPIQFGELLALKEKHKDAGYVYYKEREYGINLRWSDAPQYQWKIRDPGGELSRQAIRDGSDIVLYNTVAPLPKEAPYCGQQGAAVVYGERPYGVNLVWSPPGHYAGDAVWGPLFQGGWPTWDELGAALKATGRKALDKTAGYVSEELGLPIDEALDYVIKLAQTDEC